MTLETDRDLYSTPTFGGNQTWRNSGQEGDSGDQSVTESKTTRVNVMGGTQ